MIVRFFSVGLTSTKESYYTALCLLSLSALRTERASPRSEKRGGSDTD